MRYKFLEGFPMLSDADSAGGGAGESNNSVTDGNSGNGRDALTAESVSKMIENALSAFAAENRKFFNKEMGDRRKEIEGIANGLKVMSEKLGDKTQVGDNSGDNSGGETGNSEARALKEQNQRLLVQLELERSARKLNFASPEDAYRFVDPKSVSYDKIFGENAQADQGALEAALKSASEKYPALLLARQPDNDNARNGQDSLVAEKAKKHQLAQRFGVEPYAPAREK